MLEPIHTVISRIHTFLRPSPRNSDFDEELETHLSMSTADHVRSGKDPGEARRLARIELGGVEQLREAGRAARGIGWLTGTLIDIRLGIRMLRRYWGLTIIGGLAMAVAIGIAATVFAYFDIFWTDRVPFADGDRVVAVQVWDADQVRRREIDIRDFERWNADLDSFDEFGAFRTVERRVQSGNGPEILAPTAEMTAAGFRLAGIDPILGRTLVEQDERVGATNVVVIGSGVWQSQFGGDPGVVGSTLRMDGTPHTIVGVMPEGFGFPVNHRFWIPLRRDAVELLFAPPAGAAFGRLADGVTVGAAETELRTIGLLPDAAATEPREGNNQLRIRVLPYPLNFVDDVDPDELLGRNGNARFALFLFSLLLIPPSVNVAMLVYARTISRQEEVSVRTALGAGRGRIVVQLFLEVLVLSALAGLAVVVFLTLVGTYVESVMIEMLGQLPFWVHFGVSVRVVVFVGVLAILTAVVAGLIPALQITGRMVNDGLRHLSSRTRIPLGWTWTSLAVLQVAFSFAVLPPATEVAWGVLRPHVFGYGFPVDEYVTARFVQNEGDDGGERLAAFIPELVRRIEAAPETLSPVTVSSPMLNAPYTYVEMVTDGTEVPTGPITRPAGAGARIARVDTAYFEVFDVPVLAGRSFEPGDFAGSSNAVVVTQTFVNRALNPGENPLGRSVHYPGAPADSRERQYDIVGVVADLSTNPPSGTVYHPTPRDAPGPMSITVHAGSGAAAAIVRIREIVRDLDSDIRIDDIQTLGSVLEAAAFGNYVGGFGILAGALSTLLLAAAGIYALSSFTVSQRRKEIGIRAALGANPWKLVTGILRRAIVLLSAGALCGIAIAWLIASTIPIEAIGGEKLPGLLPGVVCFIVAVGVLSAFGPSRRALAVEPREVLNE